MATDPRRRARVLALQALYEADTSTHLPEEALERLAADKPVPEHVAGFARALVDGVRGHRAEIDAIIGEAAPQWPLADLAVVDRNILRVAVYEIAIDPKAPVAAVVNEAVEIAKSYGGDPSPRFVNGVLGAIVTRVKRGDTGLTGEQ